MQVDSKQRVATVRYLKDANGAEEQVGGLFLLGYSVLLCFFHPGLNGHIMFTPPQEEDTLATDFELEQYSVCSPLAGLGLIVPLFFFRGMFSFVVCFFSWFSFMFSLSLFCSFLPLHLFYSSLFVCLTVSMFNCFYESNI